MSTRNIKLLSILKLTRLLRLRRIYTFIRTNQNLKFSMKMIQLICFILLILHWYNWFWFAIVKTEKVWFPSQDLDSRDTTAYTGSQSSRYNLFYYYAWIILVGADILPTTETEQLVIIFMVFLSTVLIGIIIGEFVFLVASVTKNERIKSEEADMITNMMATLQIPESIHNRVIEYYDMISESKFK